MSRQRLPATKDADRPLTPQQSQIVDLLVTTGKPVAAIAEEIGTATTNVYRTLRKPHVKKELQRRTLEHIGVLAPYAAKTQAELLSSHSDHVRAVVAANILDRHLGKPVERRQVAVGGAINVMIDLS